MIPAHAVAERHCTPVYSKNIAVFIIINNVLFQFFGDVMITQIWLSYCDRVQFTLNFEFQKSEILV